MKAPARQVGVTVFGLSAIAVGIVDLVWGAFDPAHQPIQAWGDNVPGRHIFAYLVGVALVVGGAALLRPATRKLGAMLIAASYFIFAIFWLPRLVTTPPILGYTLYTYVGVLAGVCLEIIVIVAAIALYASASPPPAWSKPTAMLLRWIFALCMIDFGLQHLLKISNNVIYVPKWLPPGQPFWVVVTGSAFVLAGVAILSRHIDVLAARLVAVMLLVFNAVTLIPFLIASPHDEANWGGNFYNILAAASAWVFADWLAKESPHSEFFSVEYVTRGSAYR